MLQAVKETLAYIIFSAVAAGMESASRYDPMIQKELTAFKEDTLIGIQASLTGKPACALVQQGRFIWVKKPERKPDICVTFKHITSAYKLLLGQESVKQAYLNSRLFYTGDLMRAAGFVRIMDRVESYLFPDFIMRRLLGRPPVREAGRGRVFVGLVKSIIKGWRY